MVMQTILCVFSLSFIFVFSVQYLSKLSIWAGSPWNWGTKNVSERIEFSELLVFFLSLSLCSATVKYIFTKQIKYHQNWTDRNQQWENTIFEVSIVSLNTLYDSCVCVCTEYTFTHQAKNQTVCLLELFLFLITASGSLKFVQKEYEEKKVNEEIQSNPILVNNNIIISSYI